MLRYLRRLADEDIALDRSMIPLGSCTMKLNAAAEMEGISWPEFAGLHPFAPAEQAAGYQQLIGELSAALIEITGYDAISLQPNAGSQGELAGLLAIRAYHRSVGQPERTVCLIPESAHGTNAASAVLAGLSVVVVKCGSDGAIDLGDLRAKLASHEGKVAAIMVTYPSTNGVFEETISAVCAAVHEAGGQVYVDGANLNALVGLAKPGEFGADVSHLNLHKTFCIPHGGGGPGVGPVAARAHLAPFLPGPAFAADAALAAETGHGHPVAAAPYGSAGILPISWAYVKMMGADGLRRATQVAILSANYVARRTDRALSRCCIPGAAGLVAHEWSWTCDRSPRRPALPPRTWPSGSSTMASTPPTMSFPVAGTLMVEPTESEDLAELDRFCDAMIAIRHEIEPGRRWASTTRPTTTKQCAPHREHADQRRLEARLRPGDRGVPGWRRPARQVLAPCAAHRPGLRGPEPHVRPPRRPRRSRARGRGGGGGAPPPPPPPAAGGQTTVSRGFGLGCGRDGRGR